MCAYFTSADDIRLLCTKQHAVLDAVADLSIKIYWPLLMGVNSPINSCIKMALHHFQRFYVATVTNCRANGDSE